MAGRAGEKGGWNKAEDHILSNENTRLRRMKYINPHLTKNIDILEVGCSSGFMLWPLQKLGHQCSGVEPSGLFSDFVRINGIDVYNSIDDITRMNIQYDLILNVFELGVLGSVQNFFIACQKPSFIT
jgi:hypothetical protein